MSGDSNNDPKSDKRRYNYMENALQAAITKISVNEDDKKRHNQVLRTAIDIMLGKLREASTLFSKLYTRTFYGGSFYDNLKTGKPDEYDIDLLMTLSKKQICTLTPISEAPGFVTLEMADKSDQTELAELFDGNYLCTTKVLKWMESITSKALEKLTPSGSQYILNIQETDFYVKIVKSGPAFTLKLNGQFEGKDMNFDVDLVPCFLFSAAMWPQGKFRANPIKERTDFFIVPKQPKGKTFGKNTPMSHCWRLSFQEQERQLIHGSRTLKPAIKLMKKLRDNLQHNAISSYFIKTMFIWQVGREDKSFWENSLSYVFVEMLQVYMKHIREHSVEYYWHRENNLIGALSATMLDNYANRLKRIIADVHNKEAGNPYYLLNFILSKEDLEQVKIDVPVPNITNNANCKVMPVGNGNGNHSNGNGSTSPKQITMNAMNATQLELTLKEIRDELSEVRRDQKHQDCLNTASKLEMALQEIRNELAEVRRTQENLKTDMMNLLQHVVMKLDNHNGKS